jgi:hypothetical protein
MRLYQRLGSLVALTAWLIAAPASPVGLFACAYAAQHVQHPSHHTHSAPHKTHGCSHQCCTVTGSVIATHYSDAAQHVANTVAAAEARYIDYLPTATAHALPFANAPPSLA